MKAKIAERGFLLNWHYLFDPIGWYPVAAHHLNDQGEGDKFSFYKVAHEDGMQLFYINQ